MSTESESNGRILFASVPSAGLINPLLAIAEELNSQGPEEIWFASTDERKADIERIPGTSAVRFVSLGQFKPELAPENWEDATLRSMTSGRRLRDIAAFLETNVDHEYTEQQYRRTLDEMKHIRPTLAVIDLCTPWAIDAAMTLRVPYIVSVPVPVSGVYMERLPWNYPTPFSGLPREMTLRQKTANITFRLGSMAVFFRPKHLRATMAAFRRRKAQGLMNPTAMPSKYADGAIAVLGCSVFGLEYPFPAAPAHLKMLGAMIPRELPAPITPGDSDLTEWLARHESVVYVGFGTIMRPSHDQIQAIVEVCSRLEPQHHVLWKLPKSQQRLLPPVSELPGNLRIEEWVPSQLEILAHPNVRVFFNHAGGNAIHEGLYFGKPLLVMPFWVDCHDFAVRAVDSGAALAVKHEDSPNCDEIVAKLQRLLTEDTFRERAQAWGSKLRDAGGVTAATDIVRQSRGQILDGKTRAVVE